VDEGLSHNFWVIYALSQNFQLILGQLFLWSSLAITACYSMNITSPVMNTLVCLGFIFVVISKFILPLAYKLKLFHLEKDS